MTRVAPLVFVDDTFALKGGTAINLFVRDMPRLSVDLDLVFPDHTLPRDQALRRINAAIRQSVARLKKQGFQTHAVAAADAGESGSLSRVRRMYIPDKGRAQMIEGDVGEQAARLAQIIKDVVGGAA